MSSARHRWFLAGSALLGFAAVVAVGGRWAADDRSPDERASAPWFEEVASARGLHFVYRSGHRDRHLFPEIMGGGAALLDIDADGDLDVFFPQGGSVTGMDHRERSRLFRNRGNGVFEDISPGSGAEVPGYGMGAAVGDYDNDGDADLYVTRLNANVLLQNDGGGHFTDVTARAGVADGGWSTSAAFLDADRDGHLDLFVTHYVRWSLNAELECFSAAGAPDYCSPLAYNAASVATLFRNEGNGTFADVSAAAGVRAARGNGLGVTTGDLNGDGWVDVFVANDGTPNHLWLNDGSGRFSNQALVLGTALDHDGRAKAGMGTQAADADADGDLDLLVVNLATETDSFFRNEGGSFRDATAEIGMRGSSRAFTRFGAGLHDLDNDGRYDLFEATGAVSLQAGATGDPYAEPNLLFRGAAGGRFTEVLPRGGTADVLYSTSRGAAFGDLDNDGGIDIVVVNRDSPAHLLRNIAAKSGQWIGFRLLDDRGRDALGARVSIVYGSQRGERVAQPAYSYLSSNDPRVHFGLGDVSHVTDVRVRWPDGMTQPFGSFAAGRYVTLRQRSP
jgi:hypothetical protein